VVSKHNYPAIGPHFLTASSPVSDNGRSERPPRHPPSPRPPPAHAHTAPSTNSTFPDRSDPFARHGVRGRKPAQAAAHSWNGGETCIERGLLTKRTPPGFRAAASSPSTLLSSVRSTCPGPSSLGNSRVERRVDRASRTETFLHTSHACARAHLAEATGKYMEEDGIGENAVEVLGWELECVQVLLHDRGCRNKLHGPAMSDEHRDSVCSPFQSPFCTCRRIRGSHLSP